MNFVAFARDAEANGNVKTIARLGERNEFGLHSVAVQTGDKIGALHRSGRLMRSADDIRAEFKACIVDMFGGAMNMPKDVVEAMKLNDNGEGNPLNSRRILAVTRAIEQRAERLGRVRTVAVEKLGKKARDPEVMNLVDAALKRSLADADAADLVASAINRVVLSNGNPRSEDDGFRLVDKFMACAKDLRKAANGNPRIIDIGKKFFAHYGRPLEAGMFANIVRTLRSKSISSLKGLRPTPAPATCTMPYRA
ncbi:MAG: hypothetical protein K6F50_07380 [Kiritimatiellae bacterium]|nr:hypothetical protein [Kiritimatiellia bacterium]